MHLLLYHLVSLFSSSTDLFCPRILLVCLSASDACTRGRSPHGFSELRFPSPPSLRRKCTSRTWRSCHKTRWGRAYTEHIASMKSTEVCGGIVSNDVSLLKEARVWTVRVRDRCDTCGRVALPLHWCGQCERPEPVQQPQMLPIFATFQQQQIRMAHRLIVKVLFTFVQDRVFISTPWLYSKTTGSLQHHHPGGCLSCSQPSSGGPWAAATKGKSAWLKGNTDRCCCVFSSCSVQKSQQHCSFCYFCLIYRLLFLQHPERLSSVCPF